MTGGAVVWLRDDLRIADNPALCAGIDHGGDLTVLFVLDEESAGIRPLGAASRWWLRHTLAALDAALHARGSRLVLRRGPADAMLQHIMAETNASAVFWNRRYRPAETELDGRIATALTGRGLTVGTFAANLLWEPGTLRTSNGEPYRVFTPFWNAAQAAQEPRFPLPTPDRLPAASSAASDLLDAWNLLPTNPDWADGLRATWTPGEQGAQDQLAAFATDDVAAYDEHDVPAENATSRLSPHLRWGEVSPYQVWHEVRKNRAPAVRAQVAAFLRQLAWREFNWSGLATRPDLATTNVHQEFDRFPWRTVPSNELDLWRHGNTGFDLVDAGMRELWRTGTMHNRVRLAAASFLVKNMLTDWRIGEAWFWDTLVDADPANNPANWQWVAGSGFDAAPYFRVFNPERQLERFDPHREYVRTWIPLDEERPEPMLDLRQTRQRALDAYERMRRA